MLFISYLMAEMGMEKSFVEFMISQGLFGKLVGGFINGYWLDVLDLFNYGDQYIDYAIVIKVNVVVFLMIVEVICYGINVFVNMFFVIFDILTVVDGNVLL